MVSVNPDSFGFYVTIIVIVLVIIYFAVSAAKRRINQQFVTPAFKVKVYDLLTVCVVYCFYDCV